MAYIHFVPNASPSRRVFEYLDYRQFLRESYETRKAAQPAFSFRYIAGKIGLDPGSLAGVLKGRRRLDPALARPLAAVFNLNEYERDYFQALVLYCQAGTHAERTLLLEKVLRLRGTRVKTVDARQFEFYQKWHYSAIRELLHCTPFTGDFKRLARTLNPRITPQEAKEAVKLLLDLGLVIKDEDGLHRTTETLLTSGEDTRATDVNNFHLAMAGLAARSIQEMPASERDFSGLTLSLTRQGFEDVKAIIKMARRDILERAGKEEVAEGVYHVNFQAFPLTQPLDRDPA